MMQIEFSNLADSSPDRERLWRTWSWNLSVTERQIVAVAILQYFADLLVLELELKMYSLVDHVIQQGI